MNRFFSAINSKVITFFILTAFGVWLFFGYFYYFDIGSNCRIFIYPWIEFSNSTIMKALKIIKNTSPENYRLVCDNVSAINPILSCGGFEGGCFEPETPKTIYVSTSQRSLIFTVGGIVHETCHAIQHKERRPFDEPECYEAGNKMINKIIEI